MAVWLCGFLGVVRIVEDYVVYPRLIRHGVHLHRLAFIVAVLAGLGLGGVAGIFVAIPALAIASVTCRHWLDWHGPPRVSVTPRTRPATPRNGCGSEIPRDAPLF